MKISPTSTFPWTRRAVTMKVPPRMLAARLVGHGGFDQLVLVDDCPVPNPQSDEVLIRVGASSVNNTDINTRVGWYSKAQSVEQTAWSGAEMAFPRIQGADCCGRIVAVGSAIDPTRIGERVLVRTMQDPIVMNGTSIPVTLGSEIDGGFAQFVAVRSSEAFAINSPLTDVELASFPCAYSTAEGLLQRAGVGRERVLITGASGGVGSALVQLAAMRGASIVALTSTPKIDAVRSLGAETVVDRHANVIDELGESSVDVVIDVVGGSCFPDLLQILRPRGRYATAGAVADAVVSLDLRDLYLKDLTLFGCTFHTRSVFADLVDYIEAGDLKPLVAATYPLEEIRAAQERFISHDFLGKIGVSLAQ